MKYTDEQIEEAARILCEMRGKRPDDVRPQGHRREVFRVVTLELSGERSESA